MSAPPNDNGASGSSSKPPIPKAIGSLAKKQDDVTRAGSQKMKFVPTLPARRKKEESNAKKEELVPAAAVPTTTRGRGRGRGRGGEGRGGPPRPPPEMVASGPFALGPAMAGSSSTTRRAPRSNFTPIAPLGLGNHISLGAGLTQSAPPKLKEALVSAADRPDEDEHEVYSDQDDGLEVIDISDVKRMDWMAPESLRKEESRKKRKGKKAEVKMEGQDEVRMDEDDPDRVDASNALDLSESAEEEEEETLIDDFTQQDDSVADPNIRSERLYFFQFPEPFPVFVAPTPPEEEPMETDQTDTTKGTDVKKVSFAADVKPAGPSGSQQIPSGTPGPDETDKQKDTRMSGLIGQLEIHRSGAVKMRLGNGILLDVSAATQPSFLQHAVHIDEKEKKLCVLGEINRKFLVSPNLDALLEGLEKTEVDLVDDMDTR